MAEFESSRPSASISSESQGASNVDSSTTASTSNNNASSAQKQQPPTIVYYGAKMVRCRVERNVPLEEIVRQLCNSSQLGVGQPPVLFALRDTANNELITQDNLARKIDGKASFKLVSSPVIEAADTIERFESGDLQVIKEATFALRSYIREEPFLDEFVRRNGVKALAGVILEATGNTLAYALSAMQSILDLDHGVDDLDLHFVRKTVHIISSQALVNILRPALSILRRLVTADHPSFGFNAIWPCLTQEERFFKALGSRITREGDKLLTGGALALLNSILKVVPRTALLEVLEKLEAFNFRKAVISLIENRTEDVTPQILQFQQNYANIWYELQMQAVELGDVKHIAMLQSVYEHSGLHTENYDAAQYDYRKLGFTSSPPNIIGDFQDAGLLGLHMLHHLATTRTSEFAAVILEQVNRPDPRRCPVALVALQVSLILSEQFDLSGSLASAAFQPFLLDIYRIHLVVTEFFIRMYSDSGATLADFARVSTLVTSQVRFTLGRGALDYQSPSADVEPKTFFAIKQDFEDARYEEVRDRQMKEMEIEDDLLSKMPVRNLRDRLYRESFEFIRAQRIHCLQGGAWFTVAQSTHNNLSVSQRQRPVQGARYRFYRLAPNRRFLHFVESPERQQIRAGLDELPEKLDLSVVSDIIGAQSGRASLANQRSLSDAASPPTSSSAQSLKAPIQMGAGAQTASLSISLISQDSVIAELVAPDQATYTEWLDGLNLLLPDGFISTKETADFIQVLTDVGVKIKLLDLTGERLDIPAALPTPIVPPPSVPFYYAE